jgi:hypothetical protein
VRYTCCCLRAEEATRVQHGPGVTPVFARVFRMSVVSDIRVYPEVLGQRVECCRCSQQLTGNAPCFRQLAGFTLHLNAVPSDAVRAPFVSHQLSACGASRASSLGQQQEAYRPSRRSQPPQVLLPCACTATCTPRMGPPLLRNQQLCVGGLAVAAQPAES